MFLLALPHYHLILASSFVLLFLTILSFLYTILTFSLYYLPSPTYLLSSVSSSYCSPSFSHYHPIPDSPFFLLFSSHPPPHALTPLQPAGGTLGGVSVSWAPSRLFCYVGGVTSRGEREGMDAEAKDDVFFLYIKCGRHCAPGGRAGGMCGGGGERGR